MEIKNKKKQLHQSIRRENLQKKLGLMRHRPILIQSDSEAVRVLNDGFEILKNSVDQIEIINALNGLYPCLLNFSFYKNDQTIDKLIQLILWMQKDPYLSENVKQGLLRLMKVYGFIYPEKWFLKDIDWKVLKGYNYKLITLTLQNICCHFLYNPHAFRSQIKVLEEEHVFILMHQFLLSFHDKFTQHLKNLFIFVGVVLCYSVFKFQDKKKLDQDFKAIYDYVIDMVQKDLISEAEIDPSLQRYNSKSQVQNFNFQKFVDQFCPFNIFGSLKLIIQMSSDINCDVPIILMDAFQAQIKMTSIDPNLLKCIKNLFFETKTVLPINLKKLLYRQIFCSELILNPEGEQLLNSYLYILHHSFINAQQFSCDIVQYLGNQNDKDYPKMGRLIRLVEYLEVREQEDSLYYLWQILDSIISLAPEKFFEQCNLDFQGKDFKKMLQYTSFQIIISKFNNTEQGGEITSEQIEELRYVDQMVQSEEILK